MSTRCELRFEHVAIDDDPPGQHNDVCLIGDINGNGNLDLLVGEMGQGKNETPREIIFRGLDKRIIEPEVIAHLPTHGAKAGDITGDGMPDIAGKPYNSGKDQIDLLINRA